MGTELLPAKIREAYEAEERHHACAILKTDFPKEWDDLIHVLSEFSLKRSHILKPGGRKSPIAESIDGLFLKRGFIEHSFNIRVTADGKNTLAPTHHVDYFKNRVAIETEWNNKDPFFDRDLTTFRLLFELNVLSVGVIITRADELQDLFIEVGKKNGSRSGDYPHVETHSQNAQPSFRRMSRPGSRYHQKEIRREILIDRSVSGGKVKPMTLTPESVLKYSKRFGTILADPPWQFQNRTGKMAPEHKRLHRYQTMKIGDICALPVKEIAMDKSHLYLWCPNALLAWGLRVMEAWGFEYKTNIVWLKVRKDGGPDGRGVGFYYRNVTELVLFGTRGRLRTSQTGRRMVNLIATMKERHSKKPQELYDMIELCSPGPHLELFARELRRGWTQWGDEVPPKSNGFDKMKITPRPMEDGMIRPYRMPQLALFR